MSNAINPKHYNQLDPEPKDVIRAWGLNFNLGSAVKYISRAGYKDDIVQDLEKSREFLRFEIEAIKCERGKEINTILNKSECIIDFDTMSPNGVSLRVAFPVDMPTEIVKTILHKQIDNLFGGKN